MWTFPWTCSGLYIFYDTNSFFKLFYYYCIYSFRNFTPFLLLLYVMVIILLLLIFFGSIKGRFIGINSTVLTLCFICKIAMSATDTGAIHIAIIIIINCLGLYCPGSGQV